MSTTDDAVDGTAGRAAGSAADGGAIGGATALDGTGRADVIAGGGEPDGVPRIAVVTGAGGGIGSAVASALVNEGYIVFAADVAEGFGAAEERGSESSTGVEALGTSSAAGVGGAGLFKRSLAVDDEAAVDALFAEVAEYCAGTGGRLQAVVNVAGVLHSGRVTEMPAAEWKRLFDVNAFGVFLVSRAGLRLMREQDARGEGNLRSMLTVASNSAVVPRAGMAAYAASKAAASHFTRSLGLEAAEFGVRCNVVDPGTTRTPMVTDGWADPSGEGAVIAGVPGDFKTGIPLRRIAEPADIAGVVAFLLGPTARHMTLQEVVVDGGAAQR
ncbi:SDR family oxidoreductase [Dietzia sp.]|uniref:SDR family oxidoreductase n=1 Tax=Dietzia sp. TaxID=1871616 RepID=UPI002FD8EDC0